MLVPFKWLKEFVEINRSIEDVANDLTMVGLESSVSEKDTIEVEITPNRGDCLSILGIAREAGAIYGKKTEVPSVEIKADFESPFEIKIESSLCKRYVGRVIREVNVSESPEWIKEKLQLCGIRPINSVVDITNLVMMELGHPLHAFDLDTLKGGLIRVDTAKKVRSFITLDGMERTLPEDALLIWDAQRPVAIAGIMGGLETEVRDTTRNIFLESAYFVPNSVRKTSRILSLRTEASYRFERGTDIEGLVLCLDRATALIKEIAGGEVSQRIDCYPNPQKPLQIRVNISKVEKIIGIKLSMDRIINILESLHFEVLEKTPDTILVSVPTFRNDISREEDIVEEIARLYGYQNIPSTIPKAEITYYDRKDRTLERIKNLLIFSGYTECINYSFMNRTMLNKLKIPEGDERRSVIKLSNPLRSEEDSLRTFLIPSLIETLRRNLFRGITDVRIFEVSRIFKKREGLLPEEREHLGLLYYYKRGQRLWEEREDVFFIIKGLSDAIINAFDIRNLSYERSDEPFLHPGRSANVLINNEKVGYFGVLSPEVKKDLDLEEFKEDIAILEIDIQELLRSKPAVKTFKPLPRFPSVKRDVAIILERAFPAQEVLSVIKQFPSELVEDAWIFDLYEGKPIPEGMKSLGISILYRAKNRTLTDKEVDALHEKIITALIEKTGGRLRT